MARTAKETLSDAVARNSVMVLSLPSAGMMRHQKSRFLNDNENGMWVETVLSERPLIESLLTDSHPCGISFKTGDQKISFLSKLLRFEPEYKVNAETIVPAVLLEWPADVKTVQRRNNYRVGVPSDGDLRIRVWRIPENVRLKDKPHSTAELAMTLKDLSAGGIGVIALPKNGEPPKVMVGERLRVDLKNGESEPLVIEGRLLAPRATAPNGSFQAGIQFQRLEEGLEGRRIMSELAGMIGQLQREEVRRHRLGIA